MPCRRQLITTYSRIARSTVFLLLLPIWLGTHPASAAQAPTRAHGSIVGGACWIRSTTPYEEVRSVRIPQKLEKLRQPWQRGQGGFSAICSLLDPRAVVDRQDRLNFSTFSVLVTPRPGTLEVIYTPAGVGIGHWENSSCPWLSTGLLGGGCWAV